MKPPWHALFAPLPADAVIRRKPVGSGEAIAGWQSLTVEMSAGPAGLRHVMVTLDASGTPISAGDWVMHAVEGPEGTTYLHENVGGRLEADGSFRGTRWRSVTLQKAGDDDVDAQVKESQHSPPTPQDIAGIHTLVNDLLKRAS